MTPAARKLILTTHVTLSVGWIGAIAAFLALSVVGLVSGNAATARSAYIAMDLIGFSVIVPLGVASLTSGLVQALATPWGLFRHYWVIAKLLLTLLATGLLILHQYSAVAVAAKRVAQAEAGTLPSLGWLGIQLVMDASLAIFALLTAAVLAVYKPRGLTSYGRRRLEHRDRRHAGPATPAIAGGLGRKLLLAIVGVILFAFAGLHLAGLAGSHGH